ncbi:MAG: type II toxin-antitoxin system PemK/MazF family toxin [Sulfurimonas sp.]|uniref:type II toxin-antitoxin system PemK/MazF family toxin n=1 Tax=Sulfurimonas sp. TaxID=2022749 RepID=UPI00262E5356|nr:type II toxin-antitoxin system PemK/MazF family toxin [Sulfurimonas sp.]MDD2652263.1 type II toxin-antitoxin system PemK/MazF family toxin [Sulfurimonas sp.]MDD3451568.1 type II toxin-antitoxin system PemK/MazF family toxin [Sulfurimonas sp.]
MKRGEIYLVNFGKKYNSEFGKIRPALIIQNDVANRNIDKVAFKGVTLIPISTNLGGGDLRVRIEARDNLEKTSEICINELCTLDISRIQLDKLLTSLRQEELKETDIKLSKHLGL